MKILIVSPYHGGSHKAWAEGYREHSRHDVSLLTLPARFWKWRMHGAAVTLARRFLSRKLKPDIILATDMLDLTTFLALIRGQAPSVPAALYMHENQLTYPLPEDSATGPMRRQRGERDLHYAFINFASMLAADLVLFNSEYHMSELLGALPGFLRHFPEHQELATIERIRSKSTVLPVGINFTALQHHSEIESGVSGHGSDEQGPLVLWNQRWEYDKNPEIFFNALYAMKAEGVRFRLALCGQQFGRRPPAFEEAHARLMREIVHSGYAEYPDYARLLWEASVTISAAEHEFFGISVLEAIACHTFPILPDRLSYPELIPSEHHSRCLYEDEAGLLDRLRWSLTEPAAARAVAEELADSVRSYDWFILARQYDTALSDLS